MRSLCSAGCRSSPVVVDRYEQGTDLSDEKKWIKIREVSEMAEQPELAAD